MTREHGKEIGRDWIRNRGVAKGLESESRGGHAFFRIFFWFFVRITRVPKMDLEKKIKIFFRNFFSSSEHIFGQNLAITQGHFVGGKFFFLFSARFMAL